MIVTSIDLSCYHTLLRKKTTTAEEREEGGYRPLVEESKNPPHNQEHLDLLRRLNGQSVETLCINGCAQRGGVVVKFLKEALGFRNVRTLILSHGATELCLSALDEDSDPSDHHRWLFPIHALVIHHSAPYFMRENVLKKLLSIAQKRKVARFPFQSILMILEGGQRWGWDEVLEELRRYVSSPYDDFNDFRRKSLDREFYFSMVI